MLRTRLLFGLVPLLLVLAATGAYAIHICRELAGPLQADLVANYQAALGCQDMRNSATLMSNSAGLADPIAARRSLDGRRTAFTRELMAQSRMSAGKPRERLVEELDAAFQDFSARCDRLVSSGGLASLEEARANEASLFRVLSALDRLTASDYAASKDA